MDSEIKTARMHEMIVFQFNNMNVYEFHSDGKSSFFKSEHFSRKLQTEGSKLSAGYDIYNLVMMFYWSQKIYKSERPKIGITWKL